MNDSGCLFFYVETAYEGNVLEKAGPEFSRVFSTERTDKNGVEILEGHRMRDPNGYEFEIKFPNYPEHLPLEMCEIIEYKYEPHGLKEEQNEN